MLNVPSALFVQIVYLRYAFCFLAALMLLSCDRNLTQKSEPNMMPLSSRVAPMFNKTKTVCFGRFMVDVPESTTVVWGDSTVPLTISIYEHGIRQVNALADDFIKELQSGKAIYHGDVPLLLSVSEVESVGGRIITGYEDFESINDLRIQGYFELGDDGVIIRARPLRSDAEGTVALIKSMAARLRRREVGEAPSQPGNCIEYAFIEDMDNPAPEDLMEHIRIGFRLKEFPDAHFSIYVAPSNPHDPESDSLERQFKRFKENPSTPEETRVLARIKYFREGPRSIHDWQAGYEVLMRTPVEEGSLSHHDFQMKFTGVPHDPYKPYADIQFQTGVVGDAAGAGEASLTDEEAVAVWNSITSTIRVRPIGVAVNKSPADKLRSPLGELAATGRVCPQTGWWKSSETNLLDGTGRRHLNAGERMPHVMIVSNLSLWQRFKGERGVYRAATMWQLVDYDDALSPVLAMGEPAPQPYER